MRFVIIRVDNMVMVDGVAMKVDCSSLPVNVHAVMFDEATGEGHIEFVNKPGMVDAKLPEVIESGAPYKKLIDGWHAEKQRLEQAQAEMLAELKRRNEELQTITARLQKSVT